MGQLQLAEQTQPRAVAVPAHVVDERTAEPSVAEDATDDVRPLEQQRSDVEGVVAKMMVVARPSGREHVITDALAVELELVHAERARVQACTRHRLRDLEVAPEVRTRLRRLEILVPCRPDERRVPILVEKQSGNDGHGIAPLGHRSVDTSHADLDRAFLSRRQCRRRPGNEHRLAGFDPVGRVRVAVGGGNPELVLRLQPLGGVRDGLPREPGSGGCHHRPSVVLDGKARDLRAGHEREPRISQLRTPPVAPHFA